MSTLEDEKMWRLYTVTEKYLKEKLGILGDISSIALHSGLTPTEDKEGKRHDEVTWQIRTVHSSAPTTEDQK